MVTPKNNRKRFVLFGLIICLSIVVLLGLQNRPTSESISESQLKNRLSQLEEMNNKKEYSEIYESFVSPKQKKVFNSYTPSYKLYYIESLKKFYQQKNDFNIKFKIDNVIVSNQKAWVERSLNNFLDKSTVEWYMEDGIWYTTQEQPLCIRELPYNVSSAIVGKDKEIDSKSGVEVIWQIECGMFPIYFREPPIKTIAETISVAERARTVKDIEVALNKYPSDLLKKHLRKVYLLGSLKNFGVNYGGTNAMKNIYIVSRSTDEGYTDKYIEQMFHHEFSSILLAENDTYYNKATTTWNNPIWNGLNKSSFKYGTGGYQEIKEGKSNQNFNRYYLDRGFLNQYSMSSAENDFNEIAMNIFYGSEEFWKIVDNNPIINKKVQFFISFYHKLDPTFTEIYFRQLN